MSLLSQGKEVPSSSSTIQSLQQFVLCSILGQSSMLLFSLAFSLQHINMLKSLILKTFLLLQLLSLSFYSQSSRKSGLLDLLPTCWNDVFPLDLQRGTLIKDLVAQSSGNSQFLSDFSAVFVG